MGGFRRLLHELGWDVLKCYRPMSAGRVMRRRCSIRATAAGSSVSIAHRGERLFGGMVQPQRHAGDFAMKQFPSRATGSI